MPESTFSEGQFSLNVGGWTESEKMASHPEWAFHEVTLFTIKLYLHLAKGICHEVFGYVISRWLVLFKLTDT